MELKLQARDHKHPDGWLAYSLDQLHQKLEDELAEYAVALVNHDYDDIRDELVDIANVAMMLWDKCAQLDS